MNTPTFRIEDLRVTVHRDGRDVDVVRGVTLDVAQGDVLAVVGPSGSGKSATVLTSLGLFTGYPGVGGGRVTVSGRELLPRLHGPARSRRAWRAVLDRQRALTEPVLGRHVGVLLQDPYGALDPQRMIGAQFHHTLERNRPEWDVRKRRAVINEWLTRVDLHDRDRVLNAVPFELSGGMCQRVMTAIVLAPEPEFLISDEATSALDAPNALAVLEQIAPPDSSRGVLLITHDLGVACRYASRIAILVEGEIVHRATPRELLDAPDEALPAAALALRRAATLLAPAPRGGGADV